MSLGEPSKEELFVHAILDIKHACKTESDLIIYPSIQEEVNIKVHVSDREFSKQSCIVKYP